MIDHINDGYTLMTNNIPYNTIGAYRIINEDDEVLYVGSTSDIKRRLRQHFNTLYQGIHVNNVLQEYFTQSETNTLNYLINITNDRELAYDLEQKDLDRWHGQGKLCNIAKDARLSNKGLPCSESAKLLISEANKGNTYAVNSKRSDEYKANASKYMKEQYATGKRVTPTQGKERSEETKLKIAKAHLGLKASDETKANMSKAAMGNTRSLGRKHTTEELAKMKLFWRTARGRSVIVRDYVDNNVTIYGSMAEAAEATGIKLKNINGAIYWESLTMRGGYAFQACNVNTLKDWLKYTDEEAIVSRQKYFDSRASQRDLSR